jgi:hypothetical protein
MPYYFLIFSVVRKRGERSSQQNCGPDRTGQDRTNSGHGVVTAGKIAARRSVTPCNLEFREMMTNPSRTLYTFRFSLVNSLITVVTIYTISFDIKK